MRYQQICPVSLASEVIAERWTPLILREIVLFDRRHFSEIQHGVGRISQSLLSARLRTLELAGVIERHPNRLGRGWEYHPTRAGRELETVLNELGIWAQHWIELRQEDCDPAYLMQTVHAILRPDRLPREPLTVRFEFTIHPKIYWLVLDGEEPELCYYDPGREVGLVVTVDETVFGSVLLGRAGFEDAVQRGDIRLDGPPDLVRDFPTWLGVTRFAKYALPATDRSDVGPGDRPAGRTDSGPGRRPHVGGRRPSNHIASKVSTTWTEAPPARTGQPFASSTASSSEPARRIE
ncbi:MAG TPA: helix-turn-helix domain-containing protein [Candidatus Sulfomarinibacteraceae bacterium]|nr:helix-turn-helix domain-containing protein [Candidatus Sulfomarinibacteraceae bacterium]